MWPFCVCALTNPEQVTMTIKFLADYGKYKIGQTDTLTAAEEASLVSLKVATTDLAGGVPYVLETPSLLTSLIRQILTVFQSSRTDINGMVASTVSGDAALPNGQLLHLSNAITPKTNDNDGIEAAIAYLIATGKPGTVLYRAEDYTITRSIPLVSNISHVGIAPKLSFVANVPDAKFSTTGGTRFNIAAGVTAFTWNNVDKGADEANIATFSLTGANMRNITFIGGLRAIDIGAMRAMGVVWSEFVNLFAFDQTGDYAFDFKNFQHCWFDRLYASSGTAILSGGGIRFASKLSNALLPGNSEFGEIYTYCENRKNKSIVIESSGPAGSVLNQLKVRGRLQGNRYGPGTPDVVAGTFTSGIAAIAVPDASVFQVGYPVVFASTAPTNFIAQVIFFVVALDTQANTITLAEVQTTSTPITPGSSGTFNISHAGWPSVMIWANNSASTVSNSDFGQLDCEAYGNVAALIVSKTRNCKAFLSECMTSQTNTALVTRDAEINLEVGGLTNLTQDQSGSFGYSRVWAPDTPYVYAGGSFTLDNSWHGRCVRYTGTADITITVPNTLPKGFKFEITATAATGIVTFAAASGGAISSFGDKYRTAGQKATARLKNVGNRLWSLTGDLQV